jgi:uncharacterized membrane-anchored protein YitT (DUF2179 family)
MKTPAELLPALRANWRTILINYLWLTLAPILDAVAVIVFLSPHNIAPSGVSGLAVIMNKTLGTPIGLMVLLINIPIQLLAYRMMPGGWRLIVRTVYAIVIYTIALDVLNAHPPTSTIAENALLSTIFGGVITGITGGIIFRAGGSLGGTSTLALVLQRQTGTPMATTFLYTDALVIGIAGVSFGLEPAMYALVAVFMAGMATDYILEGPSIIRTCVIITDKPQEVSQAILTDLYRGVTGWEATGMYTGEKHTMLYVTVARTQVQELRRIVAAVDPKAFFVIGHGHTAYGEGFKRATN